MGADLNPAWRPAAEFHPAIRAMCERLLPCIRGAAQASGYAIGVHGSMVRDLDLIAAPWADNAADAHDLIDAIRVAIEAEVGSCYRCARDHPDASGAKPHGRMAFNLYSGHVVRTPQGAYPFIDISVMPKREAEPC